MNDTLAKYLIVVVAMSAALIAWVLNTWIRARYGIPTDEELALRAVQQSREGERDVPLLIAQNERLIEQVSKLEERIRVLERIATDKGAALAAEIDGLTALSARPVETQNPHYR